MRKLLLLLVLNFGCVAIAQNQKGMTSMERFEQKRNAIHQNYVDKHSEQVQRFNELRQQLNDNYAKRLASAWEKFGKEDYNEGVIPPPQPDPVVPVKPTPEPDPTPDPIIEEYAIDDDVIIEEIIDDEEESIKIDVPKPDEIKNYNVDYIDFYNQRLQIRYPKEKLNLSDLTEASLSEGWLWLADSKEIDLLIVDCQNIRDNYSLCDWGYYQLIQTAVSKYLATGNTNANALINGYCLANSGIDFRFAHNNVTLGILLPFNTDVYEWSYYIIDDKKYYSSADFSEGCFIMDSVFVDSASPFDLAIHTPMALKSAESNISRTLAPDVSLNMSIPIKVNENMLDFYSSYPRMDWYEYAKTPINYEARSKIFSTLKESIRGKDEKEQVGIILKFVQTAFEYGYDDEIWGGDRPFFPDETLIYPYSDCEDRAILFSYLIRNLTDNDVVILYYPNHLSTAVHFRCDVQGDFVMIDGVKYMVCDPTGYDPIGNAYPQFKNTKAKVFKIQ